MRRGKTTRLHCWLLLASTAAAAGDELSWIPSPAVGTRIYEWVSQRDDSTSITGPVAIRDYIEHGEELRPARLVIGRPGAQAIEWERAAEAAADTEARVSAETETEDPQAEVAALTDVEGAEDTPQTAEESLDAEAMAERIAAEGSLALYSIFFEVNSPAIREESAPTLDQVARLLAENPELNLIVVGNTDDVSRRHYDLQLSERRAAAMLKQLVKRHEAPKQRLRSAGMGFLAPVGSNDSEEGHAKNRRVEFAAD